MTSSSRAGLTGNEIHPEKEPSPRFSSGSEHLERLRNHLHDWIERMMAPLTRSLTGMGVTANQVTVAGLCTALAAAGLIAADQLLLAGLVWLLAGLLDLLDGAMARHQNDAGGFGAFFDSTLDRISEGAILAAIAYHFAVRGEPITAILAIVALLGSLLVSYTRARAESLGVQCKVGIATRAERVLLLGAGLCADQLKPVVFVLIFVTAYTVGQRIHHVHRTLAGKHYRTLAGKH